MGLAAPTSQHQRDGFIPGEPTHSTNKLGSEYTPPPSLSRFQLTGHLESIGRVIYWAHHLTAILDGPRPGHNSPAMADTSRLAPAATPFPHIRSCELCRQRKVKCDRQQPCSHCTRSGQECLYPSGPGRAPKRSRRAENAQLMDKLSRLEHIIKRLASENPGDSEAVLAGGADRGADSLQRIQPSSRSGDDDKESLHKPQSKISKGPGEDASSLDVQFGRLVVNDSMSYYVGNVLWANLANEV